MKLTNSSSPYVLTQIWELACYCSIFILGLLGNFVICLVVLKSSPSYRLVPFNIYLMSLAIVDLLLAVVCLPIYIMSTSTFSHPTGTEGVILCKTVTGYFLPFWLGGVSIYILVIISFERHTAISKPFLTLSRTTSKQTCLVIAGAWLAGLVIQIPTVIGIDFSKSNATVGNDCFYKWSTEGQRIAIYACAFTLQYVLPAVIFIVNFYRIQKCLSKLDKHLKQSFADSQQLLVNYDIKVMKRKRKTIRIVFVASLVFFICWTPNNIMYFLMFQFPGQSDISWNDNIFQAGMLLGFFNSCVNPFLYSFQSKKFRSHCKKILKKILGLKSEKPVTNVGSKESAVAL